MNRTVKEAAQVLGITEPALRKHLRGITEPALRKHLRGITEPALRKHLRGSNALNRDGTLAARHHNGGKLFMEPRVTQLQPADRAPITKHYAVLMVTEAGIDWLAAQMGIEIKEIPQKESAA